MFIKKLVLLFIAFVLVQISYGQPTMCTTLGQNPETAFPVCGTSVFSQSSVPPCGGRTVPYPCNDTLATDINPYWYKFTCFQTGTLGLIITPNGQDEDYDWQVFDITNHNAADVYTDRSLFVACDWSGEYGQTGATLSGSNYVGCGGLGIPLLVSMPTIQQGHTYLLLVSHFTQTQSGYSLAFTGGSAVITDSTQPQLKSAVAACDNIHITIALNKKMLCSSMAADGSDFSIMPASASIIGESSSECSNGFDMDSLTLTLNQPLSPGNYTIIAKDGTDGNTLLDNCSNSIPVGESVPFSISTISYAVMDSLTTVGCTPNELQLVFTTPVLCSSISPDGSDFVVTGTSPVIVTGASGNCSNGLTNVITVQLSSPIVQQGSFQLQLVIGKDGNTILDQCGLQTPAGSALSFTTKDTVSASFSYTLGLNCIVDTIHYFDNGADGINKWQWTFDNTIKSISQDTSLLYTSFGEKQASLIVSNGVCSDTSSVVPILLSNELKASFEGTNLVCPGDEATFKDNSVGNIISWNWNFGNGNVSTQQSPSAQIYSIIDTVSHIPVTLTIQNDIGCEDSSTQYVEVVNNCYIAVPSAFTPNSDGLNDYLYPLNAYKATDLTFRVYNRYGQLVFQTSNWGIKWDGTFKGQPADAGTYVWLLQYTDTETGKKFFTKGSTVLIR